MIRPPSANSPQYQRLPFTHNAIQAFLTTQSKAVLKAPQLNVKTQSSLERIKQNQLSFLRKKPSVDDMNRQKGLNLNPNNSQDLQLTPNTRIKAQQLFTKNSTQSPSPQSRLNEYTSLQGTSTKRFNHNPTGSMNVFTLQQQLSSLNKKADPSTSHTPIKTIPIEHSKSRSVVDSKENDFSSSNLLSTQESRSKPLFNQLGSPVISESVQSQQPQQKCSVHLDKKAKYLNEATGMLHCTKCAYQFALRQVNLKELPTQSDTKKAKEQEMTNLLDWMEVSQREKLPQICRSQQNQVKMYYQGQIHQCEATFKQLQGTLQQAFQKAHSSLTNSMQINLANIAIVTSNVEQMYSEVEKIKGDIKTNWNSIIQDVDMDV